MRSDETTKLWLLAIACLMGYCHASFASPLENATFESKIKGAMARVEIVYYDEFETEIDRDVGQGIHVSNNGSLITAAHVVIPTQSRFAELEAYFYTLEVSSYDPSNNRYETKSKELTERDLAESLVIGFSKSGLSECVAGSASLCTKRGFSIPVQQDFAFLTGLPAADSFVGLMGPSDQVFFSIGWGAELGIVSDFDMDGDVTYEPVTLSSGRGNVQEDFESVSRQVVPGVSGSPIILTSDMPRPSVFVGGVVTDSEKQDQRTDFKAALVENFLLPFLFEKPTSGQQSQRLEFARSPSPWNCSASPFPNPNALLADFIALREGLLAEEPARRLERCMLFTNGWTQTAIAEAQSAYSEERLDDIAARVGILGDQSILSCKEGDSKNAVYCAGARNESGLPHDAQLEIAEILAGASENGIEPSVLLRHFGATRKGSAAELANELNAAAVFLNNSIEESGDFEIVGVHPDLLASIRSDRLLEPEPFRLDNGFDLPISPTNIKRLQLFSNKESQWRGGDRAPSIMIIGGTTQGDFDVDALADCVTDSLNKTSLVKALPRRQFEDRFFPYFEPKLSPRSPDELAGVFELPLVRKRAKELGVTYVAMIQGFEQADPKGGALSCSAGTGGGACFGFAWWEESSNVEATVWDLSGIRSAGSVSIGHAGTSALPALVVPIPFIAKTPRSSCEALSSQLELFFMPNATKKKERR